MWNKQFITTRKTLPLYILGSPGPHIQQIWIACHGYAQLASDFANDLEALDDGKTLVICPEGSNYFYRKGFYGDVVSNWMTKHHRLEAIADNARYLQQVYDLFVDQVPDGVRIVLMGFSQGTATICRWVTETKPHFHDMVLWAGMPPEDIDYQQHLDYFSTKNLYLLYGTHDPLLTEERIQQVKDIEQQNNIDFGEELFSGGHEIPEEELRKLRDKLKS